MLEFGAERSALGASLRGARHSSSRRWHDFLKSKYLTAGSHDKQNDPNTISGSDFAQEPCFDLHEQHFFMLESSI